MDKLEKFILENREAFDEQEPPEGHFERFKEKLNRQERQSLHVGNRYLFLKIAAGLLIVFTVSVFIFDFAASRLFHAGMKGQAENNVSTDIRDAVNYYDREASTGMGNIRKLACCGQDSKNLVDMASKEMKSLDANTAELQNALREHPGDERIQDALIRTQQMKQTVVDHMVSGISKIKN
jgi:hypothetical protein